MKGFVFAASLVLAWSAAATFAQTPPPAAAPPAAQTPAQPAPRPPAQAAPAPRPPAQAAPPAAAPQPPAPFPQGAKIAFVDFQRIAQESVEGQLASSKINALIQKKQNEGAEKAKQLQSNQQRLAQSGAVMSDVARAQLEKEIERQNVESQRFQQDAQAEINELQMELQNDFQKKILPMLSQVSQERGLQLLLSRSDAGIVWWDPGLDLTADVVKKLDAVTPKPAAAAPKK